MDIEHRRRSGESTSRNPNEWLIAPTLATVGIALICRGVYDFFRAEITIIRTNEARSIIAEKHLIGNDAVWSALGMSGMGIGLIVLGFLARRAIEAKAMRSSYFALPRGQKWLLIGSLVILFASYFLMNVVAWPIPWRPPS